ncbi:VNG_1110C family protein [Haloplanus natans]|jgi:hypothetical protein|uniref:VNG_1110C family protein n=1 Tax=Haloplanus natans TaxID=376171 RepID=UPI000677F680|nr:hypothetical protein [Haloplanus natans]
MSGPERLRDSTQIVVPCESLDGIRGDIESEFAVSVFTTGEGMCRIVGSPVEIKDVGQFLARHGVNVA